MKKNIYFISRARFIIFTNKQNKSVIESLVNLKKQPFYIFNTKLVYSRF